MRLEIASKKAIKYACMRFHYAKIVPITEIAYAVFNDSGEWCGCVTFGKGASNRLGDIFKLVPGEYLELTRMALNGKQETTSKVLAMAVRLIKKDRPMVKCIFSYADKGQSHLGIIYQATNWIYIDDIKSSGIEMYYKGKWGHSRGPSELPKPIRDKIPKRKKPGKHKYVFPLTEEVRKMALDKQLPFPKKSEEVVKDSK